MLLVTEEKKLYNYIMTALLVTAYTHKGRLLLQLYFGIKRSHYVIYSTSGEGVG